MILREENLRGSFEKFSFFSNGFNSANSLEEQSFFYDYFYPGRELNADWLKPFIEKDTYYNMLSTHLIQEHITKQS